ncbi:MAG: sigma 54-interacting transcriptional regulator [Candidatus Zixiibacteriota bacterium]
MKKKKFSERLDRLQENFQTLKTTSSKNIKLINKDISSLKDQVALINSHSSSKKVTPLVEKSLDNLESMEKRVSQLENGIGDHLTKLNRDYQRFKSEAQETEEERRTYKILYDLSTTFYSEEDINILLDTLTDSVIDLFSAERGFLEIVDEEKNVMLKLSKNSDKKEIEDEDDKIKNDVVETVLSTGNALCLSGILLADIEEEKENEKSLKSVVCVPIRSGERNLGVIYLDDTKPDSSFSLDDVELLTSLADRLGQAVENNLTLMELKASQEKLLDDLREKFKFDEIIGNSPQMVEILKTVADVADTDSTVLIEGESGTGKELLARAIHFNSSRSKKPFVTINCAAIPETLLESELFGYEKGAFTGATQRKPGKFEVAKGGTVFLDEIGEMSPLLQVKILRFLQSHEFEPLGSNIVKRADIRIIAATNKDLLASVKENKFREDLFYRINVINLKLSPLRERRLDIAPLAISFTQKYSEKANKKMTGIDTEAMNILNRYDYPGNIRELENIIERAVILAKTENIFKDDLPKNIFDGSGNGSSIQVPSDYQDLKLLRKKVVEQVEKNFLKNILEKTENNISQAAQEAKMHRVELQRMIKKYRENNSNNLSF